MRMRLLVSIDLEPVWDDEDLTLADHLLGMVENYPSLGALVADAADVPPESIVTWVTLERDGEELTRPWPPGAGEPSPSSMSVEAAAYLLHVAASPDALEVPWQALIEDHDLVHLAFLQAAKHMHPDAGGDSEEYRRLVEARDVVLGYG